MEVIASPHIIAGYIARNFTIVDDLKALKERGIGTYDIAGTGEIFWRFSAKTKEKVDNAAGVDFSTMVFGLAAHPDALGTKFFI